MSIKLNRRLFLKTAAGALLGLPAALTLGPQRARTQSAEDRKLLFVIAAYGGGSIIDSFLPVAAGDVSSADIASRLVAYPDELVFQPPGSNIRCVSFARDDAMTSFLRENHGQMAVVTQECTSVNHIVAQKRAVNGAGIHKGRTIMEMAAMRHGEGLLLPNTNMTIGGYIEPGDDRSLPARARGEIIPDPRFFSPTTHGSRGLARTPAPDAIELARQTRAQLESVSHFGQTFAGSSLREHFMTNREESLRRMEEADLITRLMLFEESEQIPLSNFGLSTTPEIGRLKAQFPSLLADSFEAQASLAFLLARYGRSCAITLGPSIGLEGDNVPLAFDFSHTNHIVAQNQMWNRITRVTGGLINLLKSQDYLDDPTLGKMWDRSLIYIATDFGRDKVHAPGVADFGTGHNLNNGNLLISPLLRGNTVYGGVDPDTCLTHGFNLATGAPDTGVVMREGDIYSVIAQALDIDFPERIDMSAVVRG